MAASLANQLPLLFLISLDGFRHDYLSAELTPNLYNLVPFSTVGHMQSMYFTKTFPNHFSIATGLYEDEHQIVNNNMFDPSLNASFKPGDDGEEWWNPSGSLMPIWIANQAVKPSSDELPQDKRHSGSVMYPGSGVEYSGVFPTFYKQFNSVRNWTQNIETALSWIQHPKTPANFIVMYFDDPDRVAHTSGPFGAETLKALRRVDSAMGYLVKRLRNLGVFESTNIMFISDHGMADVDKITYLNEITDTSQFNLVGTSPNWSVFVKPKFIRFKSAIFRQLSAIARQNNFRIYKREDLPKEWHYSKTPRVGDFFILVDPGYDLFLERQKWPKLESWGNHGWSPLRPDMQPLFMAIGPSFKQNYNHTTVFPNIDLFPLMCFLLNLPHSQLPNNGSLSRVIDMIDISDESPSSSEYLTTSPANPNVAYHSPMIYLIWFLIVSIIAANN